MKKKRRTIELAPQTAEMFARCVAVLKPPPELTLSQWADTYRMLSAENSATPGRWHTDNAPYQREIMDAIGDQHVRKGRGHVRRADRQDGHADEYARLLYALLSRAGAGDAADPRNGPDVQQGLPGSHDTGYAGAAGAGRHQEPLFRQHDLEEELSGRTRDDHRREQPGEPCQPTDQRCCCATRWTATRPAPEQRATRCSWRRSAKRPFWDKKTVIVSTPTIKGSSRIETEFQETTREEWNVPCPKCGHYQPLRWANIVFDRHDLKKGVRHKCERCGRESSEYAWKAQEIKGHFVAANPGAAARGFHLNTLASTFCGWQEVVEKFLLAKEMLDQGDPEKMKTWVNTELGETWEEPGERLEDTELVNRREVYDAQVPEDVLVLTAGVDVQDRPLRGGSRRLGRRQGELGHPLPEDIRRYAQGTGVARSGRLPDSDVQ